MASCYLSHSKLIRATCSKGLDSKKGAYHLGIAIDSHYQKEVGLMLQMGEERSTCGIQVINLGVSW